MYAFRKLSVTELLPEGWQYRETVMLNAGDGAVNVLFSSEPIDFDTSTQEYADALGHHLLDEFSQIDIRFYGPATVFGDRDGFLRIFEWTPPDGLRVTQTQLYCTEDGRGYTATATAPAAIYQQMQPILEDVLRGLRIGVVGPHLSVDSP